jgi:hypothetical protein
VTWDKSLYLSVPPLNVGIVTVPRAHVWQMLYNTREQVWFAHLVEQALNANLFAGLMTQWGVPRLGPGKRTGISTREI